MLQKLNLKNKNLIPVALILADILWLLFSAIFKSTTVATVISLKDYLIPLLVLIYALSVNVEYKAKQYLLPVAFGMNIVFYIMSLIFNIIRTGVSEYFEAFFSSATTTISFLGGVVLSLVTLFLMLFNI